MKIEEEEEEVIRRSHMVDLHRRRNFKPELKDDFASLC